MDIVRQILMNTDYPWPDCIQMSIVAEMLLSVTTKGTFYNLPGVTT